MRIIRGLYDPQTPDGRRQIRTALLSMARKNGKTALIAALVLVHLVGPEAEPNGEIYSAARDRFQATQVYKFARQMVELDPDLQGMINVVDSVKRLVCYANGSFYVSLSSDARSKHGFNASVVIYDELAQAPNRDLWDVLTTSMGAREEPLTLAISTMTNDPNSVMAELVDYGQKVTRGEIDDPTFVSWIFEVPLEADAWDESNWYLANPALGDFRSLEEMRNKAAQAKRMPSAEAAFRNLYLNQRVDVSTAFISWTDWARCKWTEDFDPASLKGKPCFGGLDLSSTQDLTAFVLVFPSPERFDVLCWFWTPEDRLRQKEDKDKVPYPLWVREGHLEAVPGSAIRKDVVAQRLAQIVAGYDVQKIAYDRHRMEDLKPFLMDEGFQTDVKGNLELFEPFQQGFISMAPAVDALETAVDNDQLRHGGNPVMAWNITSSRTVMDSVGNRKLDKSKAKGRIDGAVSLAMAMCLATKALPKIDLNAAILAQGEAFVI